MTLFVFNFIAVFRLLFGGASGISKKPEELLFNIFLEGISLMVATNILIENCVGYFAMQCRMTGANIGECRQ